MELIGSEVLVAEATKQGLWAVLYVSLYVYTLFESKRRENQLRDDYIQLRDESRSREDKLTDFITEITKQYERLATGIDRLTFDVDEIKDEIKRKNENRG